MGTSTPTDGAIDVIGPERLIWMYTQMVRIREFEERVKSTFTEHPRIIRGNTHLADGTEASIVGAVERTLGLSPVSA